MATETTRIRVRIPTHLHKLMKKEKQNLNLQLSTIVTLALAERYEEIAKRLKANREFETAARLESMAAYDQN